MRINITLHVEVRDPEALRRAAMEVALRDKVAATEAEAVEVTTLQDGSPDILNCLELVAEPAGGWPGVDIVETAASVED